MEISASNSPHNLAIATNSTAPAYGDMHELQNLDQILLNNMTTHLAPVFSNYVVGTIVECRKNICIGCAIFHAGSPFFLYGVNSTRRW